MQRRFLLTAAALALAACAPPAQNDASSPPDGGDQPPGVVACNDVTPDMTRLVSVQEPLAAAAGDVGLRGGPIGAGTYDLIRATRIGEATGWPEPRAAALEVSESADGAVTFNWASVARENPVDRWTASFTDTPAPRMTYTCGRVGAVDAEFAVTDGELHLRLPDGGAGSLDLVLQRRT
jgi:hypothetical protein